MMLTPRREKAAAARRPFRGKRVRLTAGGDVASHRWAPWVTIVSVKNLPRRGTAARLGRKSHADQASIEDGLFADRETCALADNVLASRCLLCSSGYRCWRRQ